MKYKIIALRFDNSFNVFSNKERTELFRESLLSSLEKYDINLYNFVNHREMSFPRVIFQMPFNNIVKLHFLKVDIRMPDIYNKLITFFMRQRLKIRGINYKVVKLHTIEETTIAPIATSTTITYKLITPLVLFSGDKFKMFYAIHKKNKNDENKLENELKRVSGELIKSNLKYQMQQLIKYKKYDYVNAIQIEWIDFNIKMSQIHKKERKSPCIFGSFMCKYDLPNFIGQKIGKGFGQINKFGEIK